MTTYTPPLADLRFTLRDVAGLDDIARLPGFEAATPDLVDAVLDGAGKLAADVLAPLSQSGDREGCRLENGVVRVPSGFVEAYRTYVEGGWNTLSQSPDHGGQGLPSVIEVAVMEMFSAANQAFVTLPLLNVGANELLERHASPEQKALYMDKLVSGEWTGAMHLTEPQAGSDLGALRTKAVPQADGTYRITGQKIFISWGDHEAAPNTVNLVLARTPDAPPGSKGISLFIVPKFLVRTDGGLGARNDLRCVGLEHKMGLHGSPTCVMVYGDSGGAVGYRVGEENRGLEYMFAMMNSARLHVGLQGVGAAERAFQQARDYAMNRVQGVPPGQARGTPIAYHPDVRRMLLMMKAKTEAARAMILYAAAAHDRAHRHPDADVRRAQQGLADLLIPVVKAWATEAGCEVASLGIQVHGGLGFIEETGAAQHYRDIRIAPIYEGTNGIQAIDLVGRKILREGGRTAGALIETMAKDAAALEAQGEDDLRAIGAAQAAAVRVLRGSVEWLCRQGEEGMIRALAGATPFCELFGLVTGGWLMGRAALAARDGAAEGRLDPSFAQAKRATARFFAAQLLPAAGGLAAAMEAGDTVMAVEPVVL